MYDKENYQKALNVIALCKQYINEQVKPYVFQDDFKDIYLENLWLIPKTMEENNACKNYALIVRRGEGLAICISFQKSNEIYEAVDYFISEQYDCFMSNDLRYQQRTIYVAQTLCAHWKEIKKSIDEGLRTYEHNHNYCTDLLTNFKL